MSISLLALNKKMHIFYVCITAVQYAIEQFYVRPWYIDIKKY